MGLKRLWEKMQRLSARPFFKRAPRIAIHPLHEIFFYPYPKERNADNIGLSVKNLSFSGIAFEPSSLALAQGQRLKGRLASESRSVETEIEIVRKNESEIAGRFESGKDEIRNFIHCELSKELCASQVKEMPRSHLDKESSEHAQFFYGKNAELYFVKGEDGKLCEFTLSFLDQHLSGRLASAKCWDLKLSVEESVREEKSQCAEDLVHEAIKFVENIKPLKREQRIELVHALLQSPRSKKK